MFKKRTASLREKNRSFTKKEAVLSEEVPILLFQTCYFTNVEKDFSEDFFTQTRK